MATPARRPRLVVVVANGITGDSRVQKIAIAGARAGWETFLIGAAPRGATKEAQTVMGQVQVIRVPVKPHIRVRTKAHPVRSMITQFGIPDKAARTRIRAAHAAWERRTTARMGWLRDGEDTVTGKVVRQPARRVLGAVVRARREIHKLRNRAFGWEEAQDRKPTGNWRKDWPQLVDLDLAFGPVIERLQPDLIHANDITMIGTVALSAARMRASGKKVAWVYDAHEYVRGVDWPKPTQGSAYPAIEAEFIRRADAVVTVSPQIAEMLRKDYKLPKLPLVVRNTPIRETVRGGGENAPSVRRACGLGEDTRLLVYSGWIAAERGLGTAVAALTLMPDVHLAIVSGHASAEREKLLAKADELGVRDRIHVVPYVAPHAVPDYLSTADVGVICSKRTLNYEVSLPTKLAEYLHGGLPVVVSDVKALSEYVREHGVGEIFVADDAASFAAAVTKAMDARQRLAANISEDVLNELSWEEHSARLVQLYREVAPVAPDEPRPDVSWAVEERAAVVVADTPVQRHLGNWRRLTDTTPVRVGLGPANYAGQAAAFAQAICRDHPHVSAEVVMNKLATSFNYPADVYVDASQFGQLDLQVERLRRVLSTYTHVLVDAFMPLFGRLNGDSIQQDLPALLGAGIKVALLGHGSEVRHPARHMDRFEYSLFRDAPDGIVAKLTAISERNGKIAEETGLPLFVTTPDLLVDLPRASWAPLVVDVEAWASDQPVMARERPVVMHAPSKRWTKGTDHILPVLHQLRDEGRIELKLAEGVSWDEVREMVKSADIVLDQFSTGSYGTFAVEAMAAGRPVVGCLSRDVIEVVGADLPIVNATPPELREVLESLIADPARTAGIGAASAAFARKYHDGTATAGVLAEFLR